MGHCDGVTTTGTGEKTQARTLTRWMTDVGALSWVARAVFPVLLLAGIALRVAGTGHNGADTLITQHAAGLAVVVLVYVVLIRRGNHLGVANRAAGLDDRPHAGLHRMVDAVAEREIGV